jgi:hypothetical protein
MSTREYWEKKLDKEVLDRRARGCTCRVGLVNGDNDLAARIEVSASGRYGCKIHCTHYGIMPGGRCICGARA